MGRYTYRRYTVDLGKLGGPIAILEVERPRLFGTRFGAAWLRGTGRTP